MINVSELINDPDFTQPNGVTVIRSKLFVHNHRPEYQRTKINVTGIIVEDPNEDERNKDGDVNTETIVVLTYHRLKTVGVDKVDGEEYGADIVLFNGNRYIVEKCTDHSQYGYCRSIATKMETDVM